MKKTKLFLVLCTLLICMLIMGGCGQQAPNTKSGSQDAKTEQVLKVAIGTEINTWDIAQFPDGDARFVWSQLYETLVRLDSDLKLIPGLADSWESQQDGKVWVFHLKKDVLFHDGTPFTAEAVKYSYGDRGYVTKVKTLQLESVDAIDDYTVKFTCVRPIPLPTYLTHIAWPIVSPSSIDSEGKFKTPIGTGPFKFVSYSKGQEVVLAKNENYWGEKSKLDKVVFKIIPDASTRVMALTSGDVDMSIKIPETDVAKLEKNPQISVHRKLTTFTDFLQFNCARAPFDDVNVRKAAAYAIDTQGIVKSILNNIGIAAQGRPYSPSMMYSSKDLPLYSQDFNKAKACLAAAGWEDRNGDGICEKNDQTLQVDLILTPSWSARQQKIAEACQAQLNKAGFAVNVKQMETAAVGQLEKEGKFDMLMRTGYLVWGPYPHHVKIHTSKNYTSHYRDPAYDQLVQQAESTTDENQKQILYTDIQKMLLDKLPAFYIVHEEKIVATRNNVQGYKITAEDPWLELRGISLVKE
ncbi:MAG: ABC transporter substrate-binding protein [Syntrophomonadaceae bacterium]|nr:ABC transporter substrate-binding protein [Syntrophomonadaceae bacterium]